MDDGFTYPIRNHVINILIKRYKIKTRKYQYNMLIVFETKSYKMSFILYDILENNSSK